MVEYDRLRSQWRVSPGEYVRLRLVDALAQATGSRPNADWILAVEREIDREVPTAHPAVWPERLIEPVRPLRRRD
jgi:hypothetical protein